MEEEKNKNSNTGWIIFLLLLILFLICVILYMVYIYVNMPLMQRLLRAMGVRKQNKFEQASRRAGQLVSSVGDKFTDAVVQTRRSIKKIVSKRHRPSATTSTTRRHS